MLLASDKIVASRKLLAVALVLGLLTALAGLSLAANVSVAHAQTSLETSGGDDSCDRGELQSGAGGEDRGGSPESGACDPGGSAKGASEQSASRGASSEQSASRGASEQSVSRADGGSLPFTGYLAIAVLLLGVAMGGTGLVLRRRVSS